MGALRVGIAGAGPGGLTAAIACRRLGMDVTVFEQKAEPAPGGGGIVVADNGMRALGAIGLLDEFSRRSRPLTGFQVESGSGRVLVSYGYRWAGLRHGCAGVRRSTLIGLLLRAAEHSGVKVRFGERCASVATEEGEAVLTFLTGSQEGFDVVIAADGTHSALRQAITADQQVRGIGFTALCGRSQRGQALPLHREIWGEDGRVFGTFPLAGEETHFYCGGPAGRWGGILHDGVGTVLDSWADLGAEVMPVLRAVEDWGSATHYFDIFEVRLSRWYEGRVFALGDAAHAMCPSLGQGGNAAMVDAVVLARLLGDSGNGELEMGAVGRVYQHVRKPFVTATQRMARLQSRLLEGGSSSWRVVRSASFAFQRVVPPRLLRSSLRFVLGHHRGERRYLPA